MFMYDRRIFTQVSLHDGCNLVLSDLCEYRFTSRVFYRHVGRSWRCKIQYLFVSHVSGLLTAPSSVILEIFFMSSRRIVFRDLLLAWPGCH